MSGKKLMLMIDSALLDLTHYQDKKLKGISNNHYELSTAIFFLIVPQFLEEMAFYLTSLRTKRQEIISATSDVFPGCLHIFTACAKLDE